MDDGWSRFDERLGRLSGRPVRRSRRRAAFNLGGVQAVDLGAALAAFLREHAVCEDKQPCELRLQPRVVFDFADDIANDAAEIGLELAQRAVGTLELAGMGI